MNRLELIDENIRTIREYVPGRSIEDTAKKYDLDPVSIIKLGSNENPLGPSPKAVEAILENAGKVHLYPSADAGELVEALSRYLSLPVSNICAAGPGMDGLLDNLMRLIIQEGDEVILPIPTFSYYEIAARANGASVIYVERKEDFSVDIDAIRTAVSSRTKVIFLCSPNNPSGNMVPDSDVRRLLESFRGLVFVDEAYVEFAEHSVTNLVMEYDNLVVGRTFSKIFGLAGLRLGYGIMPAWLKKEYMKIATPFNVSLPALKAGVAAITDKQHIEKSIVMVREGRKYLQEQIPFKVYGSMANFVLVDVSPRSASEVCESLLKKGIIVRDCRSFRGAGNSLIRVTVGTQEQNARLVEAFRSA
ncbi:histidinol-phosphate transaminase [Methanomethylovorans sp.]|uniref:histidinol-phosphate transaminase n=1 Tax=Methanomethylovorans sp. TaxID=2758717 RepID=UPI002FDEEAE5